MRLTKTQQTRVNNFMREHDIDPASVLHQCCVRRHPTESWWHFKMKCKICFQVYEEERPFWTEAHTRNHRRKFDILDPLGEGVIEIESGDASKPDANKVVRI